MLLILTEGNTEENYYRIIRRMMIFFLPLSLLVKIYAQLGRVSSLYGSQMWVGVVDHKDVQATIQGRECSPVLYGELLRIPPL